MIQGIIEKLPVGFTAQVAMFTRAVDKDFCLGEHICFAIFDNAPDYQFTAGTLVGKLPIIAHYSRRTQEGLIRLALQYLKAEGEITKEPQVLQTSPHYWRLSTLEDIAQYKRENK